MKFIKCTLCCCWMLINEGTAQSFGLPVPLADSSYVAAPLFSPTDRAGITAQFGKNVRPVLPKMKNKLYLLQQNRFGRVKVMVARRSHNRWTKPTQLYSYRRSSKAFGAYVSPDEKFIVFPRRGRGSYGEEDLYVVVRAESGRWSEPVNLGPTVNSAESEIAPYLQNETLFFSSQGHGSAPNEYDIFQSDRQYRSWKVWEKPTNARRLNSGSFDALLSVAPDGSAYLRSQRTGEEVVLRADAVTANSLGVVPESPSSRSPMDQQAAVEDLLNSEEGLIFFNENSWMLDPRYQELLIYVSNRIKDQSNLAIKLVGHADQKGNKYHNRRLSKKRAMAIKQFLLSLGIDEERVEVVARGEDEPLTTESPEKNRRVEIIIAEKDG